MQGILHTCAAGTKYYFSLTDKTEFRQSEKAKREEPPLLRIASHPGGIHGMRRRLLMVLVVVLFQAGASQAAPKNLKRLLFKVGVLAGASYLQWHGTTVCQRGNVEKCNEGYGSRRAWDWFSIGVGATMIPISEACSNDDDGWICHYLGYWVPATQVYFGIHDLTVHNFSRLFRLWVQ